jgi:hypothetical protein
LFLPTRGDGLWVGIVRFEIRLLATNSALSARATAKPAAEDPSDEIRDDLAWLVDRLLLRL